MNKSEITKQIKNKALELGFSDVGFAKSRELTEEKQNYSNWLNNEYHADMNYLANNFEKRFDPSLLVENAKTIISVILNYYPNKTQERQLPQISKYAYGRDYHKVIKHKLKKLAEYINNDLVNINYRFFTDSAPVLDRKWAQLAGLGWIGKNSLLLNKKLGSFFFIGELIIDVELEYDKPIRDACGTCTKCIEACPTDAIVKDKIIDANRCISYLTIENKGEIDEEFTPLFSNQIFGCDICQDVCPWNNKIEVTKEKDFTPKKEILSFTKEDWKNLDEERFDEIFQASAIKRTKYQGIKRNLDFITRKQ